MDELTIISIYVTISGIVVSLVCTGISIYQAHKAKKYSQKVKDIYDRDEINMSLHETAKALSLCNEIVNLTNPISLHRGTSPKELLLEKEYALIEFVSSIKKNIPSKYVQGVEIMDHCTYDWLMGSIKQVAAGQITAKAKTISLIHECQKMLEKTHEDLKRKLSEETDNLGS